MLKILYIILTFIAAQTHSLNESDLSPLRAYPSNGVWRYERLVLNYQNFVDKSLLIKDFLQSDQVIAVSRPHRWGKTLNTDMLVKFLQVELDSNGSLITDNSNKILFEGGFICTENSSRSLQPLKIAKYPEILDNHQGKHYVIKLNFLLGYGMDEVALNRELGLRVRKLFYECKSLHQYFETKYTTKQGCDKKNLRAFINSDLGIMDAGKGFTWLLDCIGAHFNTTVYVFIDEYHHVSESAYSAWLHQGRTKNETYRKFCTYLGNIYTSIFKNTKNVRGLITGTSIAPMRELSKYTDLSFIKEDSLLNPIFTEHYGFIDEEIDALLSNSCLKAKSKDVKHHYRGYIVGDRILYNPLTIIECLGYNHIGSYWTKVFGSIDEYIPDEIKAEVSTLMYSNTNVTIKIPPDIPHCLNFHEKESKDVIYTRSLILGLFKAVPVSGGYYNFSMANNEIRNYTFNRMISHWLERGLGEKEICYWRWGSKFAMKLTNYEMENVEREINDDLRRFLLPRNTTDYDILEKFYNDFMTLVTFPVTSKFILNREFSINDKRTDLVLIPETSDEKKQNAVIVGYTIAESNETMSSKSVSILASLQSSNVYRNLQQNTQIKQIYSIGMAFHKIEAKVSHRVDPNPNYHSS